MFTSFLQFIKYFFYTLIKDIVQCLNEIIQRKKIKQIIIIQNINILSFEVYNIDLKLLYYNK